MVTQFNKGWVYLDHPLHRAGHALDPEHQAQNWHTDTYITDALSKMSFRSITVMTMSQLQLQRGNWRSTAHAKAGLVARLVS